MHTKVAQQMETTDASGVKYQVKGHEHPMELYAVKKDGENKGKHFFTCSICKGLGNKIFSWAEDVVVTGQTSKPTFNKPDLAPKKSGISMSFDGIPFAKVTKPDVKNKKRPAPPTPPPADDDDDDDDEDEEEDTEVSDWDAIREMAAELKSQASELEKFARRAALKSMDK
jgi:hypothetical protein